ncbi:MAG: TIGR01212 family radical SAM protein [Oscillospiraceae bacterium]|nr:TIGR01212 family radical SAM protein [Candidatus Limimonas coprohippi]
MNVFKYSNDNKRYHTRAYEGRVWKACIDAGLPCPSFCAFCADRSHLFTTKGSVTEQLEKERDRIFEKHGEVPLCAYFQSGTNTNAPVEKLRVLYDEAVSFPGVTSLSIATRFDCLPDEVLDLLEEYSPTVELGLQTIHRDDYDLFLLKYNELKKRGIKVCLHLMNGLPGETKEMMMDTAKTVGELRPDALKIHLTYVAEGTELARLYKEGKYVPMTFEDYTRTVVEQLEYIPAETVIERVTGDGDKRTLLAPLWSKDKIRVLGTIDKLFTELDTYQGKKYNTGI